MHHLAALTASLASLGLVCAIYYCNIHSRPESWLRGGMLATFLLSMLTGLFPLAIAAGVMGLRDVLITGFSQAAVLNAGMDLASFGVVLATVLVFRTLVRATYRQARGPGTVTPLEPRPRTPRAAVSPARKAA